MITTKPTMEALLRLVVERGGTDLHLSANFPPHLRMDDRLVATEHPPLSGNDVKELAYSLISADKVERFERWKELDFAFSVEGLARFRANYFIQQGYVGAAIRMLPFRIMSFSELGLPVQVMTDLCQKPKGLVLITGATGSGKTTTLAAMVDYLNANRDFHIVTIEDPIEYMHTSKRSIIDQREVGTDTQSFAQALKHVLRQDPDVILVGEMRDLETIETALIVAETGHLVLATLHTSDTVQTINRIVDVFPAHQQNQVRAQLSLELLGIISQQLIPKSTGRGQVLATEVLAVNHAVRSLVREQKIHQLYSVIQTGQKDGMHTMNNSLYQLYLNRVITFEEALARSNDPEDLKRLVSREASMARRIITKRIGEVLCERGVIKKLQLDKALIHQKEHGGLLGQILVQLGYCSEEEIALALTAQYGFPYLPLDNYEIDTSVIVMVPQAMARQYCLIPLDRIGNALTLAMGDPSNTQAIEEVELLTKCIVQTFVSAPSAIQKAIDKFYQHDAPAAPGTADDQL